MAVGAVIVAATPLYSVQLKNAIINTVHVAATPLYSVVVKDIEI